jgi:hypothetical protein
LDALEFVGVGEFFQTMQAKVFQKTVGGFVEKRTAGGFGTAGDADDFAFLKGFKHAANGDASDGFNLGT